MKKELEYIISGKVRGVMFRDSVRRLAKKLGLTGTVENLESGEVRVVAQGEETNLAELLLYLKSGPPLANVEEVKVTRCEPSEKFTDFTIIFRNFWDRF